MEIVIKYIFAATIIVICLVILAVSTCFYSLSPRATIFTSSDGITWKQGGGWSLWHLIPGTYGIGEVAKGVQDITWSDKLKKFVAVGNPGTIYTSSDGISWRKVEIETKAQLSDVIWADKANKFVMTDGRYIYTSPNGNNWTSNMVLTSEGEINDIAWSDNLGKFVAIGAQYEGMLYTSTDGTHWSRIIDDYPNSLCKVVLDDLGQFVVTDGGNTALISSDGITWEKVESKPAMISRFANATKIVWSDKLKKFVAVGHGILTSIDGRTWIPPTSGINDYSENAITWSDKLGRFVVVGDKGIYTSTDGDTWTQVYTKRGNDHLGKFNTVIWSEKLGKFIAVHIYYPRIGGW